MNNLLFSLAILGESIVNGLTGALGVTWFAVLTNFIGIVAIVIKITETQNKKRNRIVFLAAIGYVCWVVYFLLNGDFSSAFVNLIGCVQGLVFLQRGRYKWADSLWWMFLFLVVQLVASVFTYKSPLSLFSIFAGLISTIAYFVMNEKIYRYLFLALTLLWIGNGIVYFYPIAIIHDCFAAVSILIAIVRYNILGKKQIKQDEGKNV